MAKTLPQIGQPLWVPGIESFTDDPVEIGLHPLGPADFGEHSKVLGGYLLGAVRSVSDQLRQQEAGVEKPQAPEPNRQQWQHMQVVACLAVRKLRDADGDVHDLRLVLDEKQHNPENGRLHVSFISAPELARIAGAAFAHGQKAALRAARFRRRTATYVSAGRDGEEVREATG